MSTPVDEGIQRAGTDIEEGEVKILQKSQAVSVWGIKPSFKINRTHVELICVEVVRHKKHRKERNDIRIRFQNLPQATELRLPCWMLHDDDPRTILADYLFSIAKAQR